MIDARVAICDILAAAHAPACFSHGFLDGVFKLGGFRAVIAPNINLHGYLAVVNLAGDAAVVRCVDRCKSDSRDHCVHALAALADGYALRGCVFEQFVDFLFDTY